MPIPSLASFAIPWMGRGKRPRRCGNWTLIVKDDGGKLTGTLSGDPGEFPIDDAKLDGTSFSFKVVVNETTYTTSGTIIDGTKFDGKYTGPEATGTVKGTKKT